MKKIILLFSLFFLVTIISFAQQANFIKVVVPEKDTFTVSSRFMRLNAGTQPGSSVTINGVAAEVYPIGAFAGYIPLNPGQNSIIIESVHPSGGTVQKVLSVNCKLREPEKAVAGFSIEYALLIPQADQSVLTGDVIQVRMKAMSGCKAFFLGDKPMYELPESQSGGIKGIYQGSYRVKESDASGARTMDFTLLKDSGEKITASSKNTLSINSADFPAIARTVGTFPYFSYGTGEDRLGGARMSYVDTLVLINLEGRTGNLYRVRLSESQAAYIPSENVVLMPKGSFAPYSLTDSWSVSGEGKYDYLKIGLSQKLPYVTKFEINPARIIIDIYGAVSNTNWITQMNSAREIKNVYYDQPEKNVMRVTIDLKHQQAWGYTAYYEQNRLVIRVKRQPEKLALSALTIGLDAGHGGSNIGALGSTGYQEKNINIAVVLKMKAALEKLGAKVALTRQGDEFLSTTKRWQIWQKAEPDIAISFHCNSIGNSDPVKVKGTSTYYKYIPYRPLTMVLYNKMLETGLAEFGNVGSFNFLLNSPTDFPNALVEMAFMSNPEDETHLLDSKFQDKIVEHMVAGLKQYLKKVRMEDKKR